MGAFIAVSTYVGKLYSPILGFAGISIQIQPALVSLKRVSEFFFQEQPMVRQGQSISEITKVEFKDVSFCYKNGSRVLNSVNLTINKGEQVQITGENGSGKSTLLRLLVKLIEPANGEIIVNDLNLQKIDKSQLLNQITYIPQKYYLFNESIRYNITYGNPAVDEIRYQGILSDLGLSNLEEVFKKSGDEKIGENGSRLSGGERQKIGIARAFFQNHSLMILDESLSGIDQITRRFILDQIRKSGITCIIIDHQHDYSEEGFKPIDIVDIQGGQI